MTPFQALYGYPPPQLLSYIPGTSSKQTVDQTLQNRDQILKLLKENLESARNRMKIQADKHRTERKFEEGDLVYLRLQSYRQKSVIHRRNMKLSPRYYGPFQVEKKIGEVAYCLKLPESSRIHPTFHVSCLKKKVGDSVQPLVTLPPVDRNREVQPEPESVADRRMKKEGNRCITEILVKWKGLTEEENTWEKLWKLQQLYPHLVGKVL
ncbi:uncharacterized protein LOC109012047 [Juglans regia]|uniref:Uncharacterized protein LOC109012047 n=1 Tax=Juglans regia TaxID=51240 RepID=A0A2I4GYR5_JUGRE|nr:uncharacterized protein LOC109012047 [Juglans regia]